MTASDEQVMTPEGPPRAEEAQRPRLSRLAVVSLLNGIVSLLGLPVFWGYLVLKPLRCPLPGESAFWLIAIVWPVVGVVLGVAAASRIKRSRGQVRGRGLARWGVCMVLLSVVLAVTAGPSTGSAQRASRYSRAASETKTAVTQASEYAKEKGVYPPSLKVLREAGYANVLDKDPWGTEYVLSPVFSGNIKPSATDDVYVYSKGPHGTGTYSPGIGDTGRNGAVGYSSIHGAFKGC
jgi:type II secretory pathway pseudopilin PulG